MTAEELAKAQAQERFAADVERLSVALSRDLCTMTADEIRSSWSQVERAAAEKIFRRPFDEFLVGHNPIYFFGQKVFFDNDPSLLWPPLHRDRLCRALLDYELEEPGASAGLIILMQRDSFKSTFTHKVFPLHAQLRAKHLYGKDLRIAILHQIEGHASANFYSMKMKTVQHEWFKQVWKECSAEKDYGTQTEADLPWKSTPFSEPSFFATGLKSKKTGLHFDFMQFSDPVTEDDIKSHIVRSQGALNYDACKFMLDTKVGKRVIDGTRYHIRDLHGMNLETGQYRSLIVRAIECSDGGTICAHHKEHGGTCLDSFLKASLEDCFPDGLSFPTRHTFKHERDIYDELQRKNMEWLWWLQQQNETRSASAITGDSRWFRHCALSDVSPSAWRAVLVDPAWKGTDNHGKGCDAAIEVWAFERKGTILVKTLLDGVVSNELDPDDGLHEIYRLAHKWGVIDVAPEERGHPGLTAAVQNKFTSGGRQVNIIKLKTTNQGKQGRMVTFLGEAKSGYIYIANSCPDIVENKLFEQTDDFPQCLEGINDALDAAAYGCDPAVAESFVPMFNSEASNPMFSKLPWWMQPKQQNDQGFGSRYCG